MTAVYFSISFRLDSDSGAVLRAKVQNVLIAYKQIEGMGASKMVSANRELSSLVLFNSVCLYFVKN